MAGVFAISLCFASLQFSKWFRKTTAAQLISSRQRSEISKAKARLSAEIADHRATEAKLQQAQKMEAIGLLTAGVAHDFNNILLAIGGSAELIARYLWLKLGPVHADHDNHSSRGASRYPDSAIVGCWSQAKPYAAHGRYK